MNKRPAFQFYPADWRKDSALQSCSIGARGLWIELTCVMHECQPYGVLSINGRATQPLHIARLVGETEATVQALLDELENAGVFSRDENGIIYSRRIRRDEHLRNVRVEGGKLGGNPLLLNHKVNHTANLKPTPSSSKKNTYTLEFLAFYESYPLKKAKARAFKAWKQLKPMNGLVETIAQRVIELMKPLIANSGKKEGDIIFDVPSICEYLMVSAKWIYERTQLKEMPYLKVKGLLRFRKTDIDKWLNTQHTPAASTPERILKAIK